MLLLAHRLLSRKPVDEHSVFPAVPLFIDLDLAQSAHVAKRVTNMPRLVSSRFSLLLATLNFLFTANSNSTAHL